jgi:hypothetical protein
MIFIWGKKLVYSKLGYVADFCPICRTPQAFEVQTIGVASHVYYISFGKGALTGYQRKCYQCGVTLDAKPTNYATIVDHLRPLPQLIMSTFPNLITAYQAVLALEERVLAAPSSLTAHERRALIRNPLILMSPKVEKRYAATHIDLQTVITFFGVLLAIFATVALAERIAPPYVPQAATIMSVIGVVLIGWQVSLSNRRFIRRHVIPVLAKSLRPLNPSEEELNAALAELAKLRHKIGRKLSTRDLMGALAS